MKLVDVANHVAAHAARSLALAVAGAGWAWTSQAQLFTALPGIIAGDSRAGLTVGPTASPGLLYTCLVLVELLALVLIVWAVVAGMRQWGPSRVRGMASRAEADTRAMATRERSANRPAARRGGQVRRSGQTAATTLATRSAAA